MDRERADAFGANPGSAYERGGDAEDYAAGFIDLVVDFESATDSAQAACGTIPEIDSAAWKAHKSRESEYMERVQQHGLNIARNSQSGAVHAGNTDMESEREFHGLFPGTFTALQRRPNLP